VDVVVDVLRHHRGELGRLHDLAQVGQALLLGGGVELRENGNVNHSGLLPNLCFFSLAEFAPAGAKKWNSIFPGGVYVGKNSLQSASVEIARPTPRNLCARRLQSFWRKRPQAFFANLKQALGFAQCLFMGYQLSMTWPPVTGMA